jgi:galactosylceramidase
VAGLHDPCSYNYKPYPEIRALGWDLWSSEDFSRDVSGWSNSQNYWMKALSQHYVVMNITATISWSLIWSVYPNLVCRDSGLMRARWPHSGYYEVSPTIWLHAHWGQFVSPGWRFLHVPGGGSGFLDVTGAPLHGGTYVSLVPP